MLAQQNDKRRNKKMEQEKTVMNVLKMLFPALMVLGALGSLVVNIIDKGSPATSLQWIGACLLYTALMFRNMGG